MVLEGQWHAAGAAASTKAKLHIIDKVHYSLELETGKVLSGTLSSLHIGDRLGNIARKITLEDASVFTTKENDAIDTLCKHNSKINTFIHTLESKLKWALMALVFSIFTMFAFFTWGVPWGSKYIAHALAEESNQIIAQHTLDFLDKILFKKTHRDNQSIF